MAAMLERTPQGDLICKAGVMPVTLESGPVSVGDAIAIVLRPRIFAALEPV